jgi:hypothetical protein
MSSGILRTNRFGAAPRKAGGRTTRPATALCCTSPSVRVYAPRPRFLALSEVDAALVIINQTGAWMKAAIPAEMTEACAA